MKTAEELLELALPSVLEGLKKELTQTIDWQVRDTASKLVSEYVATWVKEEVIPEIGKRLTEQKEGLISLGTAIGPQVVEAVTSVLLDELKKNLSSSYKRSAIFKALFD